MLGWILYAVVARQSAVVLPDFSAWDGTHLAGLSIGLTEPELGNLAPKSKTVGPDPASVRVAVDRKGYILAAILTETNNKGHVCGFVVELEKDQPLESFDALQTELGKPDFQAYPPIRYSDWSLAVWSQKGIAAVVQNGSRPRVQRVLLSPPAPLAKSLDLWDRTPNAILPFPRVPIAGFDVFIRTDPRDGGFEGEIEHRIQGHIRRFVDGGGTSGWVPMLSGGSRIRFSETIRVNNSPTVNAALSLVVPLPSMGTQNFSESSFETVSQGLDLRERSEAIFDDIMGKLERDLGAKLKRLTWQTEGRQITSLCRVR